MKTWEETVLSKEQRDRIRYSGKRSVIELCEAQAKLSFEEGKKARGQEVVEWCEQYAEYWESSTKPSIHIPDDQWQAQKQKWG